VALERRRHASDSPHDLARDDLHQTVDAFRADALESDLDELQDPLGLGTRERRCRIVV
jgi:hypothetical protein